MRWRNALVTGASSGIGRALALQLAGSAVRLALIGRDAGRLGKAAEACAALGATVIARAVDVRDAEALRRVVEETAEDAPLDLAVANAGVSGAPRPELTAINVDGTFNTCEAATAVMRRQGHGQIALMSSLASFKGFPNAPTYCATKGLVRLYGEGLRGKLAKDGIKVSVVCPGFVKTPLTENNPFPMPFLMSPEQAAGRIVQGLAANRARIAFPKRLYYPALLVAALPPSWTDKLGTKYAGKEG